MARIYAVDPSLTSTGMAYRMMDGSIRAIAIRSSSDSGSKTERKIALQQAFEEHVDSCGIELLVIEGYALGFRGATNTVFDLAEIAGCMKMYALTRLRVPVLVVPPTNLKLFVTGSGRTDKKKTQMKQSLDAAGIQWASSMRRSDQYDAAGLLLMGEAYMDRRLLPRSPNHYKRRALSGCEIIC